MKIEVPAGMQLIPIKYADHAWLVDLHNDPEVLCNVTHPQPITLTQHLDWWEKVSQDHRQLRMIFTIEGVRVGFTKFYNIDHTNQNCVLGADIHNGFRGQGLAKFMWSLMLQKCFDELDLHRVSLTTAEYNTIGQRVYTNLGFKEEGRLVQSLYRAGRYYDQVCMRLLRPEWEQP